MNDKLYTIQWKPKKYGTIQRVSKNLIEKHVQNRKNRYLNTLRHDRLYSWLLIGTLVQYGGVKLVL
jgi:hypothetical protein